MDVAAAETWVNELDKIFEVMGCSDKQKAKQINGGMTSRMMTAEEKADLTRQAFQDRFFTKYFPPNVKEAIESDFVRIAQHPNETITEYEERFARVSRFAPHIVQDERHRARKFRDGLRFEIRRQMSILDNPTYAQVVDGAQRLERLHGEQLRIWEDKRKMRDHNESNSGGGRKPSSDAKRRSIETWVNELDKIFGVMGCSDKQKAKQINGGMTSRMMTAEEKADLTRQAFQDRFFRKYFPPNVKEAIESDFVRIAQHPNETITEYEERFARVSRFFLHIVQDERHRARKFRDGLRFEIRRQMSILDNPTYAQVVDGAQRLERLHEEQLRIWEDKRKRRDHNESNSGETWVNELDKIFGVMGRSDKHKAKQVNGGMTSRMMTAEEKADLTRQAFQDRFFTKYFPPNVKEAIESDFVRIAQHPKEMITEYEERFARVSRFALHIVQDERHRARKFRDGLRFEIRRQMSILDNPTYAQVVDGAQRLERLHEEQLRIWEDKRKRRDHNESNSGETWVNELDKIFEVMGCSDKQKAKQINGGMTSRMMMAEEKADLTRQAFQDRFFTKYFPPNVKEAIESDFVRIAQHPNETIT
ncbi:hypothetical protein RJ640_024597 [Escallonia rubra]|uniref:Retrotransposon gag domain-containing protein n=1 Tax=Escallonia rubra TaxID=112253 RepID=A0AA88URN4_9ASTE|nr:hypothetical protein RJ640_024597 [Escallonia rubra]